MKESICPSCETIRPFAIGYMSFEAGTACPQCGHVETEREEDSLRYQYHQPVPAGFLEPEFYENGPIVTITAPTRAVEIWREGMSVAYLGETLLRTPMEFRATFGNGKIPERIEWINNAWFDLYEVTDQGFIHLDFVCHEIDDAIATAKEVLSKEVAR